MWDDVDRRIADNEADDGAPVPLRHALRRKLEELGLVPSHATKKMVAFALPDGARLLWNIEGRADTMFLSADRTERARNAGYDVGQRPFIDGMKDGGRHSALSREWSFGEDDAIAVRIADAEELERFAKEVLEMTDDLCLRPDVVDRWVAKLLRQFPGLQRFDQPDNDFDESERDHKLATAEALHRALVQRETEERVAGIIKALSSGNLLNWRVTAPLTPTGDADRSQTDPALLAMAEAALGEAESHAEALARFVAEWTSAVPGNQTDSARQIGEFLLMHLSPNQGIFIRHTVREELWREATGQRFPVNSDIASIYRNEHRFMRAVQAALTTRGLHPRDMIDVQSALWVVHSYKDDTMTDGNAEEQLGNAGETIPSGPLNTILYGPPGTGKTWETAQRAVAICDPAAELGDREAVMARYRELCTRHRIEFVTFHQSYGYEEFVEGLRPETGEDADGEAGFRLVARDGVLKRIAARASSARGATPGPSLDGRRVFKMSLGRNRDDEFYLRDECLEDGVIRLGNPENFDWTDPSFDSYDRIFEHYNRLNPGTHGNSAAIVGPFTLRVAMREGDVIIASAGTTAFQAIGLVTGPCEYDPDRQIDDKTLRRKVRWVWTTETPRPATDIYQHAFRRNTLYRLVDEKLNKAALEELLAEPSDAPPPAHVLIIDEINRANISKVMGELITLLEEDKRAGAENELAVTLPHSGDRFTLPGNLHIIGTMNTADRSIALLDTALRRRFRFEHLAPDGAALADWQRRERPNLRGEGVRVELAAVLAAINQRIEWLLGPDHLVGHGWFMKIRNGDDLDEVMAHKVIPLLREYFHEDLGRVRAVLGGGNGFLRRERLPVPPGLEDGYADERWRYIDRFDEDEFYAWSAYDELVSGQDDDAGMSDAEDEERAA
ncbi:5-methylcytosine-specific restriction endonuclease McrBC, GTP-binding regulatory subunit McrB [Tranquillimonas rosea]|uniref:5-methylcytosine-specific restriction endonuclease McrBC, GTP-binding regulatory subunit McrB n=1 Tax=Tranquillimonas rosea TaxID=641238 RepID=A0A1H9PHP0_9RHOB|nr:AAA family ATPase [Tranquillimonas rosea]SER47731.1 5-methylcytosine-specific restriction endonuclease McrBC, GTP-binding regulatory subunit McrB [Tranquillimonas rosea]